MEHSPAGGARQTPLNAVHRQLGARMVLFGGWDMPVEYSGLIAEHMAVREAAGMFDVSHMGEFEISGPGALAFLQRTTSNDVARLADGQGQYTALPLPNGAAADDAVLYRFSPERFLMVVNAGNIEKDFAWLQAQQPAGCELRDRSHEFALVALQGPRAQEILQRLTDIDLPSVRFYHFAEGKVAGMPAVVSRTGYTGEDGFEVFVAPAAAVDTWRSLMEGGRDQGLVPAGLGARDTLRLEARMCLYGNDLDETTTLVEAGLGWIVSVDPAKGDYPGRAVLEAQKKDGPPRKLVGFEVVGRGIARHGHPVHLGGQEVGTVTSGTFAPYVKKTIGLCYLPAARSAPGTEFEIDIRGRRVPARVVPTPFYKRAR
ncbi:MAG TPA: glycine cleavage system aminomethyltransferase GcvT [Vicinamibacteria bacterium]|nr:glycine cleavage system aminomethyltransferase GcvT [Vicinamibacteria bacterium]